jgi:hypothetical protein
VGSDTIQLSGDYSAFGSEDWATAASAGDVSLLSAGADTSGSATAQAFENGKLYVLADFASLDAASQITAMFATAATLEVSTAASKDSAACNEELNAFADKYYLASGSDAMLLTGKEGTYKLWYIDNDKGGGVAESEITLVGTFNTADDAALTAACFAAGA